MCAAGTRSEFEDDADGGVDPAKLLVGQEAGALTEAGGIDGRGLMSHNL